MPVIRLQSSDGQIFPVDSEIIATQSVTIRQMLEELEPEDEDDVVLPLPHVDGPILQKVITWCNHHMDNPVLLNGEIGLWDEEFLKVDQATLFDLIMASYHLEIKGLMNVTCKCVAGMIKGRTPREIRKLFAINTPGGDGASAR